MSEITKNNDWIAPAAAGLLGVVLGLLLYRFAFTGEADLPAICVPRKESAVECARAWLGVAATAVGGALTLVAAIVATKPVWKSFYIGQSRHFTDELQHIDSAGSAALEASRQTMVIRSSVSRALREMRQIANSSDDPESKIVELQSIGINHEDEINEATNRIVATLRPIDVSTMTEAIVSAKQKSERALFVLQEALNSLQIEDVDEQSVARAYQEITGRIRSARDELESSMRDLRRAIADERTLTATHLKRAQRSIRDL